MVSLAASLPPEVVPLLAARRRPEGQIDVLLMVVSALVLATAWAVGTAVRVRRLYAVRTTASS